MAFCFEVKYRADILLDDGRDHLAGAAPLGKGIEDHQARLLEGIAVLSDAFSVSRYACVYDGINPTYLEMLWTTILDAVVEKARDLLWRRARLELLLNVDVTDADARRREAAAEDIYMQGRQSMDGDGWWNRKAIDEVTRPLTKKRVTARGLLPHQRPGLSVVGGARTSGRVRTRRNSQALTKCEVSVVESL